MRKNPNTPPNGGGTIFVRKEKGRKLHFVCGGPTYADAQKMVRENDGWVALWQSFDDSKMYYVFEKE